MRVSSLPCFADLLRADGDDRTSGRGEASVGPRSRTTGQLSR
ncbi:MAG: hypothetical protein AVDCRST_MAG70-828 [uncultured Thermomicrobiales bacterium]|uniref:Uncharacterized protein n=1 Tax=uncultured Thermomicrobiales bacterium TaxID=1645740 RepID=A0A6J4UJR7_9BACT|nr:MAG: hypothetical protein AVDCRST_MAG70-828 [uncultured Thermomicrobiales bacterium]